MKGHSRFCTNTSIGRRRNSDGEPRDERSRVDDYWPDLVDLEPRHAPETVAARRELLAAERPHIEHFEYADTWGYAEIHIRSSRINAEIYRGLDHQPWKRAAFDDLLS